MKIEKALVSVITALTCLTASAALAKEGDILWQRSVGENLEATPAIDNEGNVYVAASGKVHSYAPDGTHRWTRHIGGLIGEGSSPSVSPDQTMVYGPGSRGIYAIDAASGELVWESTGFPVGFFTVTAVSTDSSRLYVGAGGNDNPSDSFYCINAVDGSVVWEYELTHPPQKGEWRGFLGGAVIGADGTIYVSSQHGWLVSLTDNGDSYTENWAYSLDLEARQPPTIDKDGYILASSNSGKLYKIDPVTGKSAGGDWPVDVCAPHEVFAAVALGSDGAIYVNGEDLRLHAVNPDGSEKWTLEFETWGSDPLVRDDGDIIVMAQVDGAGRVVCIKDVGTGGTIEWASDPIVRTLNLNETNVNIAPNGTIYVTSGDQAPLALFAVEGNGQGLSKTSPWPKYMGNIQNNGSVAGQAGPGIQEQAYNDFFKRVQEEEPYIGFFAVEQKCITTITDTYENARREFFLGIRECKEDTERFIEPFMEFCKGNELLVEGREDEWQKTLVILSYELYANMPIFEFSADNVIEHRGLVFAEYPNKKLELDLFLPEQPLDEPMPCVVCIHGGGWRVNRRLWFEPFATYLASKGIAAVTIDYRMLPAVRIIDCVYDCKAAVRWVRANAEQYGIDPDRIGALGASAGAHLIALLATTADVAELEGSGGNPGASSAIQAGVGFATPAFRIGPEDSGRARRFGLSTEEMNLISPYENISSSSAPLYLVHGTADSTVRPQDSQDLHDKYKEVGAHVQLKWIPDKGHGFYEGTDMAIELATTFFKEQFSRKQDVADGTVK